MSAPDSEREQKHKALGALLDGMCTDLAQVAIKAAAANCGVTCIRAGYSAMVPEVGAMVIVLSGKITDEDMRKVRDVVMGLHQDITAGCAQHTRSHVDQLGPSKLNAEGQS